MSFIERLPASYRAYSEDYFIERSELSSRLAADPGDLFVVHNVAYIVPPADGSLHLHAWHDNLQSGALEACDPTGGAFHCVVAPRSAVTEEVTRVSH